MNGPGKAFLASLVLVLLASCTAAAPSTNQSGESVRTATVERGSIDMVISGTGQIEPAAQASLSFNASGNVGAIHVEVGDGVQAGDPLIELAASSLDPALLSAEAELIQAENNLESLLDEANWRAQLAEAQRQVADAEDALEDAEYLHRVRQQGNRASQRTIDAAEAQLVLAEAALRRAKGAYDRLSGRPSDDEARALALTNLNNAQRERDSVLRSLNWYKGAPSAIEQAQLDADVALAEANLAQALDRLETLEDGPDPDEVAMAEAQVRAAQARVAQANLTAPFDGTVLAVNYNLGDSVVPGQPAVVIADLSQLHIDTNIDELDIATIEIGQPVFVTLDALPELQLQGTVVEIDLTPVAGSASTEYPVRVNLDEVDPRARTGMTSALEILVASEDSVLLVPNWALRFDSETGELFVNVQTDDGVEVRPVTLAIRNDSFSQVVSGLEEGDLVTADVSPPEPSFPGPFGR